MNNDCEMVEKGLCLGCVGLAEDDWCGKYKCSQYYLLKSMEKNTKKEMKYGNKIAFNVQEQKK